MSKSFSSLRTTCSDGKLRPDSHWATALWLTSTALANCAWVKRFRLRAWRRLDGKRASATFGDPSTKIAQLSLIPACAKRKPGGQRAGLLKTLGCGRNQTYTMRTE